MIKQRWQITQIAFLALFFFCLVLLPVYVIVWSKTKTSETQYMHNTSVVFEQKEVTDEKISVLEANTSKESKAEEETMLIEELLTESSIEESVEIEEEFVEETTEEFFEWNGKVLNAYNGLVYGPSGKETYYNLNMKWVVERMQRLGYDYEYYIREDGVKMFGPYVMCAANFEIRPLGTILETSLGTAIVCDTGEFVKMNPTQIDIAVEW